MTNRPSNGSAKLAAPQVVRRVVFKMEQAALSLLGPIRTANYRLSFASESRKVEDCETILLSGRFGGFDYVPKTNKRPNLWSRQAVERVMQNDDAVSNNINDYAIIACCLSCGARASSARLSKHETRNSRRHANNRNSSRRGNLFVRQPSGNSSAGERRLLPNEEKGTKVALIFYTSFDVWPPPSSRSRPGFEFSVQFLDSAERLNS